MKINEKEILNSFMNYIMQLRNTPEEELSELGKLSKLWADDFTEENFEKWREIRTNLSTEQN